MMYQVVFVCVANRSRSVFAQFFFSKMLAEKDTNLAGKIKVLSAGFVPQRLKEQLGGANVPLPEPFFNRPMAGVTRTALIDRGIQCPDEWVSREVTHYDVKEADLIVTVLDHQKDDLIHLFPYARDRIFTLKELAEWAGYLILEDYDRPPLDHTYWHFVDEDPVYAFKILSAMVECLIRAFPKILQKLGIKNISDN